MQGMANNIYGLSATAVSVFYQRALGEERMQTVLQFIEGE